MIIRELGMTVFGLLCGSILFGRVLPKWIKGIDVTEVSNDHNPGTANAMKYAGVPVGILCLLGDLLKGALPVYMAVGHGACDRQLVPAYHGGTGTGACLFPVLSWEWGQSHCGILRRVDRTGTGTAGTAAVADHIVFVGVCPSDQTAHQKNPYHLYLFCRGSSGSVDDTENTTAGILGSTSDLCHCDP